MQERPKTPRYVGARTPDRVMTRDEVKARFDAETAHAYSQEDPVYLPEYSSALSLLIDSLQAMERPPADIIDLGAGTGNLARRILERLEQCHVTLVDFSDNMLHGASEVLADFPGRYTLRQADFLDAELPESSCDAVVSSFAIHHARGKSEYLALYKKIARCLRPRGIFAVCDLVKGATDAWTRIGEQGWRDHLQGHFDRETIERIFQNCRSEDTPMSLPDHLECLAASGFAHADILWKRHCFAVYCAQL